MLGLGSYPANGVSTFHVTERQATAAGHYSHRSHSPWSHQSTALAADSRSEFQNALSSRHVLEQFTPTEYPIVTKLPPRQLQWVSSQTHGYETAPLAYDIEAIQSKTHQHLGQLRPAAVSTLSNPEFSSSQVIVTTDVTGPRQTVYDTTKNYFNVDCSLEQAADSKVATQPYCRTGNFVDASSAAFVIGHRRASHLSPSSLSASDVYSGCTAAVKSDPEGPPDWHCTQQFGWYPQASASNSLPGLQAASVCDNCPLSYISTLPYRPASAENGSWSASCEQTPAVSVKIKPSMSIGKTRTRDKYRTVYTEKQRLELEAEYERSTYVTSQRKAVISSTVGLSDRQIKIWFQNRRAKERKQMRRRNDSLQQQHELESETETSGCASTSYGPRDGSAKLSNQKFVDSALFYDSQMTPMTSNPTYLSSTTR